MGDMAISCDCKSVLDVKCIHSRLIEMHFDDFGTVYSNGEEADSYLICKDSGKFYFSVSTFSGRESNHNAKRIIVFSTENLEIWPPPHSKF
jgi:hypothetical protein